MLHHSLLFLILLISCCSSLAQAPARCIFSGSLQMQSDLSPLASAEVFLSEYAPLRGIMDVNWTSATTDSEGRFSIDVKGTPRFMRVISKSNDTIDVSLEFVQCNTSRDIIIKQIESATNGSTYQMFDAGVQLPEIVLEAYGVQQTAERIPASIGSIDRTLLLSTDQTSLQNALNTVPGVIMESRGYGGSHRLSIRGSSLRSPFAVRNVKMYLDGIPLTSADGQTPLELIDPFDIQTIEVIKGPAGSMYGNGNGGVLLLKSMDFDSGAVSIQSGFQAASYRGYRATTSACASFQTSQLRVSHEWQEYGGYRDQEFNRKQQVSIRYKQQLTPKQTLSLWGTYYYGNWGLPGALNRIQADTLPTQAVLFSYLNNASLARTRYVGAVSQEGSWGKQLHHSLSFNYHQTNKENPYGTSTANSGYKFENSQSLTGRALVEYKNTYRDLHIHAAAGAEWQLEHYSILEQTIDFSEPRDFKYYYDVGYRQSMVFGQTSFDWKDVVSIQSGLSLSNNEQFVRGRNAAEFQFDTTTTWGSYLLPRLAVSLKLCDGMYLFRSYSAGAANPTVFEMIDQENSAYNLQLITERGRLHELGLKHEIQPLRIRYSITLYQFNVNDAILPYTVSANGEDPLLRYHNDGSTQQNGFEWNFRWTLPVHSNQFDFSLWNNGAVYNQRFDKYTQNELILNGNRIPGVPISQSTSGAQFRYKMIRFSLIDYWMDRMPLSNDNTAWTNPYHLLNVFTDITLPILKNLESNFQFGLNNVLNAEYSSYLNLNANAGKYYNPTAPRNWFIGLRLQYMLAKK